MNRLLLINPWIYDFAAYDLWIKPWGFLKISAILKKQGFKVNFIDLLDDSIEDGKKRKRHSNGTGKFFSEEIVKPGIIKNIPRRYKRYGIRPETFQEKLPQEPPDCVFVSSGMTYWYPGTFSVIKAIREKYKNTQIVLGGIYATLAYEHALQNSGADLVIRNSELNKISSIVGGKCDFSFNNILNETIDYDWYSNPQYAVLRVSIGCPFDCSYCAQKKISPEFIFKDIDKAVLEFKYLYDLGIRNFAFYDDALLFDQKNIIEYFQRIRSLRAEAYFYTPNGLHARYLSEEIVALMKEINFINPILSLEIADDKKSGDFHSKVTSEELILAVGNFNKAGYKKGEYTVYLMLGMPGISIEDVDKSLDFVHSLGGRISLSEFTPVSGTVLSKGFPEALEEPLLQNNSVFPAYALEEWGDVQKVKRKATELNRRLVSSR